MKTEHKVEVENHIGTKYTQMYWAENVNDALEIALSEAYPFGIKRVNCTQSWAHKDFKGAFISIDQAFESTFKLPVKKKMKHKHKHNKPIW